MCLPVGTLTAPCSSSTPLSAVSHSGDVNMSATRDLHVSSANTATAVSPTSASAPFPALSDSVGVSSNPISSAHVSLASMVSPTSSSAPSCNMVSTSSSIPPSTTTPISLSTPLSVVSHSNSASLRGSCLSSARISPIDKYLRMGTPGRSKPSVRSSSTRAITGARVLTSSECLAIIKGKEMKKKLEQEEKEKRKIEREEKKKKQEEKQKKSFEKLLRRPRRLKRRKKRRHGKLKRELRSKQLTNEDVIQEESSSAGSGVGENVDGESGGGPSLSTSTQKKRRASSSLQVASKRQCLEETDSDDKCCVCFPSFEEDFSLETGVEWVQCSCTHWLHEDCILDCIISFKTGR